MAVCCRVMSNLLEVDPLRYRQPLQISAQAVEAEFGGAEAHPFAPAENAGAPGRDTLLTGDRQVNAAAEIDAVRALVHIDQHRQRVARAGLALRGARHLFRRFACDLARTR